MTQGPSKPPRPPNSYMLFRQHITKEIASQTKGRQGPSQKDVSTFTSSLWSLIPQNVKIHFELRAKEADALHKRAYPGYRYSPQRKKGPQKNNSTKKRRWCNKPTVTSGFIAASVAPQATSTSLLPLSASPFSLLGANQNSSQQPYPMRLPPYLIQPYSITTHSNPGPPVSFIFRPRPLGPPGVQATPYCRPYIPCQLEEPMGSPGSSQSLTGTAAGLTNIDRNLDVLPQDGVEQSYETAFEASYSDNNGSAEEEIDFLEDDMNTYFRFSDFLEE